MIEYIPLLQIQRDLYSIPRGPQRFQAYLNTILNEDASDIDLFPLNIMNPMGKDHLPAQLDKLLAMDADAVAAGAIAEVAGQFEAGSGALKLGLVVADDMLGGWTNRYTCDFAARFNLGPSLKRGWLSVILWASEPPSEAQVREQVLVALYRAIYIQRRGAAHTLQEILDQEGYAMAKAGCRSPWLDPEDLAYTEVVISPYLTTQNHPTIMACLFGDRAAHALGYKALGLSENAGLALALQVKGGSD